MQLISAKSEVKKNQDHIDTKYIKNIKDDNKRELFLKFILMY